ncbi:ATP synthase subunit I [Clostridium intestinale]|uniref:ATP synthase subunit I n=1 Tax=Clostridium intestinale TaxID=36845 RepID=UPI002DD64FE1|nr:ATP synthase subunit I [Clostridium intestinale]WRY49884.1 ATP synthase subunit I [Clostridium intestinale]
MINLKEGNYQLKTMLGAMAIASILSGIMLITIPNPKSYIYGLMFTTTITILNFRLMSMNIEKAIDMPGKNINKYILVNYTFRYIIYGIAVIISFLADYINIYTALFGLFTIKIVIISDALIEWILDRFKNK